MHRNKIGQPLHDTSSILDQKSKSIQGGYIPGVRIESSLGDKYTLGVRGGYNVVRHRDLGKNDDERGGGFGFSAGIKRYFKNNFRAWHLGLRTDIWFNAIDWKNDVGLPNETSGNTDVLVVQPTVELGYAFLLNRFVVSPAIAFGWEFNAKTRGRATGEGPILLAGVTCALRI